jgi:opacity protein-like surface antigen
MRPPAKVAGIHIDYGVFMKNRLLLGLLTFLAVPVFAEGVYVFGDLGEGQISIDIGRLSAYTTDTSFSAGVGYELNATVSFEAGYRKIGSFVFFRDEDGSSVIEGEAVQGSVLAKHPISDIVNVYGRLGVARVTYDLIDKDFNFPRNNETNSKSKNKIFLGVGASYEVNEQVDLRIEYNRSAEFDDLTWSSLTFGASYSF